MSGHGLVLGNFVLSSLTEQVVWHTIRAIVTGLDGLLFGLLVILGLSVLLTLAYLLKREYWKDVH